MREGHLQDMTHWHVRQRCRWRCICRRSGCSVLVAPVCSVCGWEIRRRASITIQILSFVSFDADWTQNDIIKQKTEGWVWHQTHLHGYSGLIVNLQCLIHWPECCSTPSIMLLAVQLHNFTAHLAQCFYSDSSEDCKRSESALCNQLELTAKYKEKQHLRRLNCTSSRTKP